MFVTKLPRGHWRTLACLVWDTWGKYMFSPTHRVMKTTKDFISITPNLRAALSDWHTLIQKLGPTPTPV